MIFSDTDLPGVQCVALEQHEDTRGFFARAFCAEEFARHGLFSSIAQINVSATRRKGTIRGIHFQRPPAAEAKLVRCVRGAILDVAVDLRRSSTNFGRWTACRLDAETGNALYLPEGFGHAFQALTDDVEMLYLHSTAYQPHLSDGVRFDDPTIGIEWPLPVKMVSDRDRALPLLDAMEPI
ncbi:dTDP-4-dehydrorhamnose 3,5-epimerase [Rhodobacterales bacterium HKCCE3408]|nr:dTDP-4-dehydrorhamnose 3,5-epimerase [Rhodobacterales bacterium HKCCE3408]